MEHSFLNARIVDRVDIPKRHPLDRGFVVQESNAVFYRKKLEDVTVMMSDYIDEDELHPYRTSGRIRKDISVGYVRRLHFATAALFPFVLTYLFVCQLQDRAESACEC